MSIFNSINRLLSADDEELVSEAVKSVTKIAINPRNPFYSEQFDTEEFKRKLYKITHASYMASTGVAWSYETFLERLYNWTLFVGFGPDGEPNAYIAIRVQGGGDMAKLVAVAGNALDSLRIFKDHIVNEEMPIWGMVSKDLALTINRMNSGFKALIFTEQKGLIDKAVQMVKQKALKLFVSKIARSLPKSAFSGRMLPADDGELIDDDGGIMMNMEFDGISKDTKKYLVANKLYLRLLMNKFDVPQILQDMFLK